MRPQRESRGVPHLAALPAVASVVPLPLASSPPDTTGASAASTTAGVPFPPLPAFAPAFAAFPAAGASFAPALTFFPAAGASFAAAAFAAAAASNSAAALSAARVVAFLPLI